MRLAGGGGGHRARIREKLQTCRKDKGKIHRNDAHKISRKDQGKIQRKDTYKICKRKDREMDDRGFS